jgi:hypothetical protein
LIGFGFLEAYEAFGDEEYLAVADGICRWIIKLPRNQTDSGFCFGYLKDDRNSSIHNSNMIGAAMLARTASHSGNAQYLSAAKEAMKFSCTRQLPSGAWYYGEDPKYRWIDSFHTGYNLDGLKAYIESSGDKKYIKTMIKGIDFYKTHFFEANGRPKYYHDRTFPVDSQCASQAIDTLANFSEIDESVLKMALRVALWWIDNMQDEDGFFYYRQYPAGIKAKTPMLHWAQATTYKALALLLLKMNK